MHKANSNIGCLAPYMDTIDAIESMQTYVSIVLQVARAVGHGLVWTDDARGLGVLWVKVGTGSFICMQRASSV